MNLCLCLWSFTIIRRSRDYDVDLLARQAVDFTNQYRYSSVTMHGTAHPHPSFELPPTNPHSASKQLPPLVWNQQIADVAKVRLSFRGRTTVLIVGSTTGAINALSSNSISTHCVDTRVANGLRRNALQSRWVPRSLSAFPTASVLHWRTKRMLLYHSCACKLTHLSQPVNLNP